MIRCLRKYKVEFKGKTISWNSRKYYEDRSRSFKLSQFNSLSWNYSGFCVNLGL